jgi:hypothetical protein
MRILDRWTLTASMALVIAALMACKKKEEPPPPAPAPTPTETTPAPSSSPSDASAKSDDVKRYGDKEKDESGTVRVIYANAKVYNEADESTRHIATLSLGTLVNRKARYGNWMLVDWPSGVGELSPGWILAKHLDEKVLKIDLDKVKHQDAGVVITDAGVVPTVPDAAAVVAPDAAAVPAPDAAAVAVPDAGSKGGKLNWGKLKTK